MSEYHSESLHLPNPAGGQLYAYLSHSGERSRVSTPSNWAIVYVHGFASNSSGEKAKVVEAACAHRGWTYAAFDFRGHGQSTGTLLDLRGSALLDDLDVVRSWLASHGVQRLCLYGYSMGGWASAWYALRRPEAVVACALVAPAFRFPRSRWDSLSEAERRQWRGTGRLRVRNQWIDVEIGAGILDEIDQFPVSELAARLARPLLIFHGLRDDTVPYSHSLEFTETARHPAIELRLYRDGDHRLLAYKEEMADAACGFFEKAMSEPEA
ncbi:MAG TPA: alpha/beta fold hydrolase [Gemmataceae bacterium]|nr:alpha/beta fold hydrolase [Gemmataceae bacterium]